MRRELEPLFAIQAASFFLVTEPFIDKSIYSTGEIMTKQDLIKLAEVAKHGVEIHKDKIHAVYMHNEGWREKTIIWQPHIDIAQAFEVLDNIDKKLFQITIHIGLNHSHIEFWINGEWCDDVNENNIPLPELICQAVLKANKQER